MNVFEFSQGCCMVLFLRLWSCQSFLTTTALFLPAMDLFPLLYSKFFCQPPCFSCCNYHMKLFWLFRLSWASFILDVILSAVSVFLRQKHWIKISIKLHHLRFSSNPSVIFRCDKLHLPFWWWSQSTESWLMPNDLYMHAVFYSWAIAKNRILCVLTFK